MAHLNIGACARRVVAVLLASQVALAVPTNAAAQEQSNSVPADGVKAGQEEPESVGLGAAPPAIESIPLAASSPTAEAAPKSGSEKVISAEVAQLEVERMTVSRSLIEARIQAWMVAPEAPSAEDLAVLLSGSSAEDFKAYNIGIQGQIVGAAEISQVDRAKLLKGNFQVALELLNPSDYPSGGDALRKSACWDRPHEPECDSRFGGFSAAARNRFDDKQCWESLDSLGRTKSAQFREGYLAWWKKQIDPNDSCEKPPKPARCLVAWCSRTYDHGLAFRPAIQLGGSFGGGLGFSSNDASFSGQLSTSLGVRFFFLNDSLDVHGGLGIGASTQSVVKDDSSEEKTTAAFLLTQLGVGAYNGMFGLSWLHTLDPRNGDFGNGLALFVDVVAVERLVKVD